MLNQLNLISLLFSYISNSCTCHPWVINCFQLPANESGISLNWWHDMSHWLYQGTWYHATSSDITEYSCFCNNLRAKISSPLYATKVYFVDCTHSACRTLVDASWSSALGMNMQYALEIRSEDNRFAAQSRLENTSNTLSFDGCMELKMAPLWAAGGRWTLGVIHPWRRAGRVFTCWHSLQCC